jgi:DNA-nicking Smr family endonuclease
MKKINPDDIAFFRAQMQGVKPLDANDKNYINPPPPLKTKSVPPEAKAEFPFSDFISHTVSSEEKLFFTRGGLQEKALRDLRQGKIKQEAILDLHGNNVEEARTTLSHFLDHCLQNQYRCVRIVHGKGKLATTPPILKNHVNSWLQQHPAILAFCSTAPRDGGTGAVYVLLKRKV